MSFLDHFSGSGVVGAAISLSVTTIGAGVLALPSAFQDGGIFPVIIIFAFVGFMTVVSIDYLIRCIDTLHLKSYEDIARELLGRHFEELVRWILIIYTIGIASGYIVVMSEIFTPLLPIIQPYIPYLSSSTHVMLFVWVFVMLPLACIPHITKMNIISIIAISASFLISGIIVYRYYVPIDGKHRHVKVTYFAASDKALLALPVLMFSFDCQSLVFQIYTNLGTVTRTNMKKVSIISVSLTSFAYAAVGIFGYLSNSPNITGNILTNYDPIKDHLFAVGEAIYSFTVITAYVLVLFPSRDAVFILLFGFNSNTHELAHEAISPRQNLIVSVLLSALSLVLALRARGIVFIIAILGGLCSSTLCFTYPAAFRLMLHARGLDRCKPAEYALAIFMLIFGVVGGILGTYVAIRL